jgi:multidrug efflux system outer membrane protein
MTHPTLLRRALPGACALAIALAGCAVGPDYRRPSVPTPAAFAEPGPWKVAAPKDDLPKGAWWRIFRDPTLDRLESEAASASPTLGAALARCDQALAAARISRAALLPGVGIDASGGRERFSANRQSEYPSTRFAYTTSSFDIPLDLTYEIDLFGQARRSLESARAAAEAQGAEYQNVLLGLQAAVAQNYFSLRSLVSESQLLARSVALRRNGLDLVRTLRAGGANSDLDVYQAETELATVESADLAVGRQIADLRHALAVLVGQLPERFELAPAPLDSEPPAIPAGLPSELLERRPDVAAAERTLASASAQIGVAKAGFFPSIGLTAFAGVNSDQLNNLLQWSSREWAAGPLLSLPIFRGGSVLANYRQAQALYRQAVEAYRGQVLGAFQDVEDGLSDLSYLSLQEQALGRAAEASRLAAGLSTLRYKAGLVSYLEVIDSERTELDSEVSLEQARADRYAASILLVRALGGGW